MSGLKGYTRDSGSAEDGIVRKMEELSTLPAVAIRVMQIANDPDSGALDLTEAMESDTSLSARVLRYVNSSASGVRQKITNLQQAIAYLGVKQIRNLAMTASVSELFKMNERIGPYDRKNLWRHLVAVGICGRMVAQRLRIPEAEDVFLAGLLHDIGIIIEDQQVHESFRRMILSLREDKPLPVSERAALGFDHTTLGERLAQVWGFPDGIKAAIRYHHMSSNYRGRDINLLRCVEVANLICSVKGITSIGPNLVVFSAPTFAGLSLTKNDIRPLLADLDKALEENASLFSV
ncbi:MAG: HDOD domain-containing protein [Pirellulales bacterium]|nr:HDOD domain-containing protein [Pirellulales bacterium]